MVFLSFFRIEWNCTDTRPHRHVAVLPPTNPFLKVRHVEYDSSTAPRSCTTIQLSHSTALFWNAYESIAFMWLPGPAMGHRWMHPKLLLRGVGSPVVASRGQGGATPADEAVRRR